MLINSYNDTHLISCFIETNNECSQSRKQFQRTMSVMLDFSVLPPYNGKLDTEKYHAYIPPKFFIFYIQLII